MAADEKPAKNFGAEEPTIRTMKTDAAELVKEQKLSPMDIKTKTYIAQGTGTEPASQIRLKKILYWIVALAAALALGYVVFLFVQQGTEGGPILEKPKPPPQLLLADDEKTISFHEVAPGELVEALRTERARRLRFGTIIYFPLEFQTRLGDKKYAASQDLFKVLSWNLPAAFRDNASPHFNALVAYGGETNDIAVLVKTKNFSGTFASLLDWESRMWQDWRAFLSGDDVINISQFSWKDEIIKNNDARVFQNKESRSILAYSIFNKEIVIFSTSREGLAAILERLIKAPPR